MSHPSSLSGLGAVDRPTTRFRWWFDGVVLPTIWSSLQRMFPSRNVGVGAGLLNGLENIIAAVGTYILGISFAVGFPYLIIFAFVGGISGLILTKRGY